MSEGHSPIGASSAHRWLACPGSVRLSRGLPNESSWEAKEGTAAHEVAAECLRHGQDAWEHAGRGITIEGDTFVVDDEMVEAVQVYLDAIRADADAYRRETGAEPIMFVEQFFHLEELHPDLYGTADCALVLPAQATLKVYDLKYGRGLTVEPGNNPQFLFYAAGVVHKLSGQHHFDFIDLHAVQPRRDHPDGPVRRWSLTADELGEWVTGTLVPGARATEQPDAPLRPGDHCRFCPAKQAAVCPALAAVAENADTDENVAALDTEALAERLEKVPQLRMYIQALEDEAFRRMMKGETVPGYKLVQKKANRVWKEGAEAELVRIFGAEAVYEKKLRTPSQVERLKDGRKVVSELAYKPDTGLTVAPESDRREAVPIRSAQDVFADV